MPARVKDTAREKVAVKVKYSSKAKVSPLNISTRQDDLKHAFREKEAISTILSTRDIVLSVLTHACLTAYSQVRRTV
jgi:hypothetical protein